MSAASASKLAHPTRFRSWPITEAKPLEPMLREMGLRVPAAEIDGTAPGASGKCLSDALVSVGPAGRGGTGSFISSEGLIITNHHVALDAVRQASSADKDYVANGFVARSKAEEIAGPDYEVWITRSCEDVSEEVLKVLRAEPDPLKRANRVRDVRQEMARAREAAVAGTAQASGLRCEVQEMWAQKTYVMFTYERLRDVRIVYVPPFSLGCFGGDTDNFEWPRHTADFTLLRAYVAPDGTAAEPSPENVPYQPSRYLRASKSGVAPDDFVFLLGFPGSTMRYAPASRLSYSDDVAVPALVSDFAQKLRLIHEHSTSRAAALKLTSAKKGLANEFKRSAGKKVMMRRLGLIAERRAEEVALVEASPDAAPLLERLQEIYDELRGSSTRSDALDALAGIYHGSTTLAVAHALHEASVETAKPDGERETAYRARNLPFLIKRLSKRLKDLHPPHEAALLRRAVAICANDAELTSKAPALASLEATARALEEAAAAEAGDATPPLTGIAALGSEELEAALTGGGDDELTQEPAYAAASQAYTSYVAHRDRTRALLSERDQLLAKLLELQAKHSDETFYPDANGCLRLSAGHVEGYSAADAVVHTPVTTIGGLVEKHEENKLASAAVVDAGSGGVGGAQRGDDEFACPERLVQMCKADARVSATPNCILYSTDTVGGNSGSPVLDKDGAFVAINFDRQRLGLMNEFKWSKEYSRSIGTDVRYILWLVGEYDDAPDLVEEMTGSTV